VDRLCCPVYGCMPTTYVKINMKAAISGHCLCVRGSASPAPTHKCATCARTQLQLQLLHAEQALKGKKTNFAAAHHPAAATSLVNSA
jgi:hypothetical protein